MRHAGLCALLAIALAACGGGGGDDASVSAAPPAAPSATLHDATPYSSAPGASLATSTEAASVTSHTLTIGATTLTYSASAGHLDARDPRNGVTEASLFYVAYTLPGAPAATRPLVFFYNGGPGSATVWLHLGSFAPRRIVTDAPSLAVPLPFRLVDNAESLIDVADLVFVDAVGTGYSQAVAPFTNRSFWSVDADAALMRDFIARYVAVHQRSASPTYLFGESYGTTRSAVLADLMLAAGMRLDGVILQSSVLDYNSNCDVFAPGEVSCEGFLPSYGEVGAWHGLSAPPPPDADAFAGVLREFATDVYGPAVAAFVATGQAAPPGLVAQLIALTGAPEALWNANLDLDPLAFRSLVLPGRLMGRYDARIVAANGSALAASGDPSSTLITAPFAAAAQQLFQQELLYSASARYTLLSNAIASWDFRHDGEALPDTIPDVAAALARHPGLRVLSLAGYHDLATPFLQTELDLDAPRTAGQCLHARVPRRSHDLSRRCFAPASEGRSASVPARRADGGAAPRAEAARRRGSGGTRGCARRAQRRPGPPWFRSRIEARSRKAAILTCRRPCACRRADSAPRGAALAARVREKIAARDRDVYR